MKVKNKIKSSHSKASATIQNPKSSGPAGRLAPSSMNKVHLGGKRPTFRHPRLLQYFSPRHCERSAAIHTPGRRHCERSVAIQSNKRTRQCSQLPSSTHNNAPSPAFTIVELLVVIIVIAILAAITIVGYRGVSSNARKSALSSNLEQANKSFNVYKESNSTEVYPSTLSDVNSNLDTSIYTYYPSSDNKDYCLQGTTDGITKSITGSSQTVQASACTENGLVGWWKLNGDATDSSGLGNNGTLHGTTTATGPNSDGALYFNGTSDYISVNNFDYGVLTPNAVDASWTMSIWAKYDKDIGGSEILLGKLGFNGGIMADTSSYYFYIYNNSTWPGAGLVHDYSWHFLTGVYSDGNLYFYCDGTLIGAATTSSIYSGYENRIDIGSGEGSWPFSGTLDDARIYTRALSANEVLKLYQNGAQ